MKSSDSLQDTLRIFTNYKLCCQEVDHFAEVFYLHHLSFLMTFLFHSDQMKQTSQFSDLLLPNKRYEVFLKQMISIPAQNICFQYCILCCLAIVYPLANLLQRIITSGHNLLIISTHYDPILRYWSERVACASGAT